MTEPADTETPPEAPAPTDAEANHFLAWLWDTLRTWGPALLAVLLIRSVFAEPFRIPSGSMVPTLQIGDHILVTKYSYGLRIPLTRVPIGELDLPERGDIVVFVKPGTDDTFLSHNIDLPVPPFATLDYVKRVVGLPGDVIEVRDNQLYINSKAQPRQYQEKYAFVNEHCRPSATKAFTEDLDGHPHTLLTTESYALRMSDYGPQTVPPGQVFVMGDNRDHSADSRVWGYVPLRNIKGKARFVWLSYDQCKTGLPLFGEFRDGRFGTPL